MDTHLFANVFATWQEGYEKQIQAAMRRGRKSKLDHGGWPTVAPLGYRNVRIKGAACVEKDPLRAPLVTQAFYLAACGKYPLREVLALVTVKGLTTRNGKPLSISTIWSLLKNPFYMGEMHYGDMVRQGFHEPLIDRHTFETAQRKLARRRKR